MQKISIFTKDKQHSHLKQAHELLTHIQLTIIEFAPSTGR